MWSTSLSGIFDFSLFFTPPIRRWPNLCLASSDFDLIYANRLVVNQLTDTELVYYIHASDIFMLCYSCFCLSIGCRISFLQSNEQMSKSSTNHAESLTERYEVVSYGSFSSTVSIAIWLVHVSTLQICVTDKCDTVSMIFPLISGWE